MGRNFLRADFTFCKGRIYASTVLYTIRPLKGEKSQDCHAAENMLCKRGIKTRAHRTCPITTLNLNNGLQILYFKESSAGYISLQT